MDVSLSALLRFPDGRAAGFDCGYNTALRKWIEVAGDSGSLVCDDFARPRDPAKTRFWTHGRWGESAEVRCPASVQEDDLIAAFVRAVRAGPDHAWADVAVAVQRVCDATLRAARTGETVVL